MKSRLRLSIKAGVAVELTGLTLGVLVLLRVDGSNPFWMNLTFTAIGLFSLWYFPHSLAHLAVGSILGVKFRYFYIASSSLTRLDNPILKRLGGAMPTVGVKINRRGFEETSPRRRASMFVSGTLVSLLLPLLSVYTSLQAGERLLAFSAAALIAGNTAFTLYFSPKVGDISRALNALKP